jgi:Tfp pilus assembly protein PilV
MIKKIKKNRARPAKLQRSRGFVILFAVTLSAILLSIALGVANIALKEINFGTSAEDTNNAFFAADTGAELALFNDKTPASYPAPTAGTKQSWNFVVSGLGNGGTSCALVSITKDNTSPPSISTTVVSKGYNLGSPSCNSTSPNLVERELDVTY